VKIQNSEVEIRAWLYTVTSITGGEIPVLFLDTDIEENKSELVYKENLNNKEIEKIKKSSIYLSLLEMLVLRIDDKHYHYYETLGKYYELENEYNKAIKLFEKNSPEVYDSIREMQGPNADSLKQEWKKIISVK